MGLQELFSGLLAKLGALSVPAKVLMALGLTAASVTATGAAGALPGPAQHALASVVNGAGLVHFPDGSGGGSQQAGGQVDVTTPAGSAQAGVNATAPGTGAVGSTAKGLAGTSVTTPSLPPVSLPKLPSVPGLPTNLTGVLPGNITGALPSCMTSIIDPTTGKLLVSPTQAVSMAVSCVQSLVPTGVVPPSVSQCLSSVLGSLEGIAGGGLPTSIPNFNISSCVPIDQSACVSSVMAAVGTNPLSIFKNLTNLSNLTKLANLPGCVPPNVSTCLSSIFGAIGSPGTLSGGLPKIDLSACLPTGMIGSLPIPH